MMVMAMDEITVDDGQNILSTYETLMETVIPEEREEYCYEYAMNTPPQTESIFCRQDMVEAAAGFFYLKDTKARSNLWRMLKGFQGPWSKKEFYPKDIKSNTENYTLNITNRDHDSIVFTFPILMILLVLK